jgi:DNA-binding XRE family transcriptional regulator
MLPFCDRVVSVPRKDVAPVWTRSFLIAKEPITLGQQLKKKRFLAGIRQSEAAQKLGVSRRTLSVWETDRVYPAWAFQPLLVAYLGYDPFNDPTLGRPKGNETSCVAFLSPNVHVTLGQKIRQYRLKLRKTRKQMALELGISVKTLWGWETDRVYPAWAFQPLLIAYLGYDPFNDPTLGRPKGNETSCVAFLSPDAHVTLGQKIKQYRLKLRKTRKQIALELGISVKTLWGWETDRREPAFQGQEKIARFLARAD